MKNKNGKKKKKNILFNSITIIKRDKWINLRNLLLIFLIIDTEEKIFMIKRILISN